MQFFKRKPSAATVIRESLIMIIGAVLIWRGIWVLLDLLDARFFSGSHELTALIGIVLGIVLVYYIDQDLKDVV